MPTSLLRTVTAVTAVAAIASAALDAGAARAATTTATGTITAGTLTVSTSATPTFGAALDGTDKTPTYTLPMTVNDATGSGAGWKVTLTSTQFATSGGTTHSLATTASKVTGVTSSCAAGTCTAPSNTTGYPFVVPADTSAPTAVSLFNSAADTGMGQFTVTPTVAVSVPANTYAGTYTSTLTLAAVSGP